MSTSSTFPGLPVPKKKRNPKGIQLSAAALAPPPLDHDDEPPVVLIADMAGGSSSSSSSLSRPKGPSLTGGEPSLSSSFVAVGGTAPLPLAPLGSLSRASGISRKKPLSLDISKSITSSTATRPAPIPGGKPRREGGGGGHGHSSSTSSTREKKEPRVSYQQKLSEQLASLDLGGGDGKTKVALKQEDLKVVGELGSGNGGTVAKVLHGPSGLFMARKLVLIDAKPAVRKQILRELQIMHDCESDHIVSFHGAFLADPHICICMEHMDRGSLDNIYRKHGPVHIDVVGKISIAVLEGLTYLYDAHRIIHRDVKPSNILVNSAGQIKLCDFGVSGELINSIANTFVGTSTYMSPERIQGAPYTVKSDVWSLGISLIELALGRFPFSDSDADSDLSEPDDSTIHSHKLDGPLPPRRTKKASSTTPTATSEKRKSKGVSLGGGGMTMSILDLLQHIVNEPAPRLGEPWGDGTVEAAFVDACLRKDADERPSPPELLQTPWMSQIRAKDVNLKTWAEAL